MVRREPDSIDLTAVLSSLTGRRVRIGEIVTALDVGRSTYYEQRDEGRLVSADNLLRLAQEMGINPVELLLRCGLVTPQAVAECGGSQVAGSTGTHAHAPRTRRFQRRPDAPPI